MIRPVPRHARKLPRVRLRARTKLEHTFKIESNAAVEAVAPNANQGFHRLFKYLMFS